MLKLGHYLRPSIDIGPAMTAKVLIENRQVLHISMYRPLTLYELLGKEVHGQSLCILEGLGPTKRVRGHRTRKYPIIWSI